jgi:hypothetical protein
MLEGYGDIYVEYRPEPSPFDSIEAEPLPEMGPVQAGVQDAADGTPDWTRTAGDPVYRVSLIKTLLEMSQPTRKAAQNGRMTNATGLSAEDAWAMSGAPGGSEEW